MTLGLAIIMLLLDTVLFFVFTLISNYIRNGTYIQLPILTSLHSLLVYTVHVFLSFLLKLPILTSSVPISFFLLLSYITFESLTMQSAPLPLLPCTTFSLHSFPVIYVKKYYSLFLISSQFYLFQTSPLRLYLHPSTATCNCKYL